MEKRIKQNTMKMCGRGKRVVQYQHSNVIQPVFPLKDDLPAQSDLTRLVLFSFVLAAKIRGKCYCSFKQKPMRMTKTVTSQRSGPYLVIF